MTVEKILGEGFRAFEARGAARRARSSAAWPREAIDDAGDQRPFGPDDGEADILGDGELKQRVDVIRRDPDVAHLGFGCRAGVAGRDEDMLNARRRAHFHASACSRPPPPTINTFIPVVSSGGNGAFR